MLDLSRAWRPLAVAAALLVLATAALSGGASTRATRADDDQAVGRSRPAMGWSTWSFIRHNPTEANVEATAKAMHDSGLQAHGFQFVNVDDFYYLCPDRKSTRLNSSHSQISY